MYGMQNSAEWPPTFGQNQSTEASGSAWMNYLRHLLLGPKADTHFTILLIGYRPKAECACMTAWLRAKMV